MPRIFPKSKIDLPARVEADGKLLHVPVDDVQVLKGLNVRVDLGELTELMTSIATNGFYEDKPLSGYMTVDNKVIVIDGHRRLAAISKLNDDSLDGPVVTTLPVVVAPESATLADLTIRMYQSAEGKHLSMFEKGVVVKRLIDSGMTQDDIAKRLGVSDASIKNFLLVASAPAKARDLFLDNKVTATQVLHEMQHDPKTAAANLQAMVETAASKGRERARPSDAAPKTPRRAKPVPPASSSETLIESHAATVKAAGLTPQVTPIEQAYAGDPLPTVTESEGVPLPEVTQGEHETNVFTLSQGSDMSAGMKQMADYVRSLVAHDRTGDDVALATAVVRVTVTLS